MPALASHRLAENPSTSGRQVPLAGAEVEAVGLARAKGYEAQAQALGAGPTALVNVATALAGKGAKFVPDVLLSEGTLPHSTASPRRP